MARLTQARQIEIARQTAENRARRLEYEATHTPRALNVDDAAVQRRDQFAAQLMSYYEFLIILYLPADCLKRPPDGGWPHITAERLSFLGKTDAVVDLLKHIPYIGQDRKEYSIFCETNCIDYSGSEFERDVDAQSTSMYVEPLDELINDYSWDRLKEPQHLATLGGPSEKYGSHVIIDTRDDQLAMIRFVEGIWNEYDSPKNFFDDKREALRELVCLPIGPTNVRMASDTEDEADQIRDIFKKYGWPSTAYQKESCMAEVAEVWRSA